jgi:hypothetical protein
LTVRPITAMPESLAAALIHLASAYLLAGLIFSAPFLVAGIGHIDPQARATPLSFRMIVLPGVLVLWPLLAWRWLRGAGEPPEECSAHIRASRKRP